VIGFRATIVEVAARFKLGQDERPEVLEDIVAGFTGTGLASWMQRFNADRLTT
jgi:transcriptional regulator